MRTFVKWELMLELVVVMAFCLFSFLAVGERESRDAYVLRILYGAAFIASFFVLMKLRRVMVVRYRA